MAHDGESSFGKLGRFALYTAVLYASFVHDVFNLMGYPREAYIGYDSYLVLNRLQLARDGQLATFAPLGEYWSQFGLQGIVLTKFMKLADLEPVAFSFLAAKLWGLLTAMTLAAFFVSASRIFGNLAAATGVFLTSLSPIMLEFAPSLYWSTFLLYLPFVAVWIFDPWLQTKRWGIWALLALVFTLVLMKALCGYEYITTVILSPLAAVFFYRYRDGRLNWRSLGTATAVVTIGIAAFGTALLLHVIQLEQLTNAREKFGSGWACIAYRASLRVNGAPELTHGLIPTGSLLGLPEYPSYVVRCFFHYFELPAFRTPRVFPPQNFDVSLGVVTILAIGLGLAVLMRWPAWPRHLKALGLTLGVAILAPISWQVAAINHMCVHFHLNPIVFLIPFLPLAYVGLGYVMALGFAQIGFARRVSAALVPASVALVLAGLFADHGSAAHRQAVESNAWAAVNAFLANEKPGDAPDLRGSVDVVQSVNYGTCTEMSRSRLVGPQPVSGTSRMIGGWVCDSHVPSKKPRWFGVPRPGVTVVAVQGHHAVPSHFSYVPRRDIVKAMGNRRATGFELLIPGRLVDNDEPLRLFMVSESDPTRVHELAMPAHLAATEYKSGSK